MREKSGNFNNVVIYQGKVREKFPAIDLDVKFPKNYMLVLSSNHFFNKKLFESCKGLVRESLLNRSGKTWKSQGISK